MHLLFVIASPPQMSLEYLHALSTLVRVIRDGAIREALLAAQAAREIEEQHPRGLLALPRPAGPGRRARARDGAAAPAASQA